MVLLEQHMDRRRWRHRLDIMAILLSLAGLAGCQHLDLPLNPQAMTTAGMSSDSKLKTRQLADVQVGLAHSLEKQGQIAQAITAYQEAVRLDPSRADACLRLAILYNKEGKFQEALPFYQKALAGFPGNPDIFCDMGYGLYLQRRFTEAEADLRQAIALAPEHTRAHNNLGLVLAHSGRCEEALAEFRRAGCTEADAEINLAFALTLENNCEEARRCYQKALAVDVSSSAARKGLQELDTVLARADKRQITAAPERAEPRAELGRPLALPVASRNQ
jgi:Tfp pilus assembly protein PilF